MYEEKRTILTVHQELHSEVLGTLAVGDRGINVLIEAATADIDEADSFPCVLG
ncbi:hypothetical protein MK139_18305 [bacterium]|jgi:hypothetical protein|nr:hypothetical protein [bacterium]